MARGFIEDLASGVAIPLFGRSYRLLQADPSHDMWALGALMYCPRIPAPSFFHTHNATLLWHQPQRRFHVATGCTLWHCDREEHLVDEGDFLKLGEWKDEVSVE